MMSTVQVFQGHAVRLEMAFQKMILVIALISMNAKMEPTLVLSHLSVLIQKDHTHALANLDSLGTALTVKVKFHSFIPQSHT